MESRETGGVPNLGRNLLEAASVVEPPINQVPLDQVHVLAADRTGAADCAACHRLCLGGVPGTAECHPLSQAPTSARTEKAA